MINAVCTVEDNDAVEELFSKELKNGEFSGTQHLHPVQTYLGSDIHSKSPQAKDQNNRNQRN